jgi:hypothetical protein
MGFPSQEATMTEVFVPRSMPTWMIEDSATAARPPRSSFAFVLSAFALGAFLYSSNGAKPTT